MIQFAQPCYTDFGHLKTLKTKKMRLNTTKQQLSRFLFMES